MSFFRFYQREEKSTAGLPQTDHSNLILFRRQCLDKKIKMRMIKTKPT